MPISKDNIDERAKLIVDQYKKKAALFKTGNNVLIPLGDDFKYFDQNYMDAMTKNFDPLFKYINENRSKFKVRNFDAVRIRGLTYCRSMLNSPH